MAPTEQLELAAYREQLQADVRQLVDKYLAIAEWDVPDIDEPLAMQLSIAAIRRTLDQLAQALPNVRPA